MKRSNLCKKGLHRMTASNTYEHPEKGPECRECKREYMRLYMRERRAAAAAKRRTPAKRAKASTRSRSSR